MDISYLGILTIMPAMAIIVICRDWRFRLISSGAAGATFLWPGHISVSVVVAPPTFFS